MPINPDSPLARMERALINADNAGDIDAASKLAQEIRRMKQAEFSTPVPVQNGTGGPPKARADDVERELAKGRQPDFDERTALQRGLGIQPRPGGGEREFLGGFKDLTDRQRRALGQGATLGFMDELEAAAQAGGEKVKSLFGGPEVDFGDRYAELQAQLQAEQERFQQQEPGKAIAGALLGGGAIGGGLIGAPKIAARIGEMGLPGKAVTAAGIGAGTGAASGAGTAAPGERLQGAGVGAALGAVTGAAVPAIGAGIGRLASRMSGSRDAASESAQGAVRRGLRQQGLTDEQAAARLQEMGPDASVADVMGTRGDKLMFQAASTPGGRASQMVDDFLEGRVSGELGRLKGKIQQITGNQKQYLQTLDELAEQRKQLSAPLYEEARSAQLQMTPGLQSAVKRLSATGALRKAAKKARLDGDEVDENVLDVKRLDYAKRALDDDIGIKVRAGKRDEVAQLTRIKNDLLQEMDAQVPAYQKARQVFSGIKEIENATEQGAKFLRGETDIGAREFAKLTDAQKEGFKIGAMRALNSRMAKVKDDASIANMFKTPDMRERMRFIFDTEDQFDEFIRATKSEQRFAELRNVALKGSQTAERRRITEEGIGAAEGAGLAADVATGGLGGIMRGLVGVGRRIPGVGRSPREAEALARALMSRQLPSAPTGGGRILLPGSTAGGVLAGTVAR